MIVFLAFLSDPFVNKKTDFTSIDRTLKCSMIYHQLQGLKLEQSSVLNWALSFYRQHCYNGGCKSEITVFILFYLPPFHYICFQKSHTPMNTPETFRHEYQSPALRIIPMSLENAICDSSIPGGNEDIGYEDWDQIMMEDRL